jgi:hypothetical protein
MGFYSYVSLIVALIRSLFDIFLISRAEWVDLFLQIYTEKVI